MSAVRNLCRWLIVLWAFSSFAQAETIRITNGEWSPYMSEQLPYQGLASRIVREAFAMEGVEVVYGFFPWTRSFELARDGYWDGAAIWHHSPERERDFYISDPVLISRYVLFHRIDRKFDWSSLDDLTPYRIGATQSYDYGQEFTLAERQRLLKVERVARDELNFAKLLANRIDLFPMDQIVGLEMLRHNQTAGERSQISFHPRPLRVGGLHLLLSRKVPGNAERMARFNRGLQRLRQQGLIDLYQQEASNVSVIYQP